MNLESDNEPLFETGARSIRRWRIYWWVVMLAGPAAMTGFVAAVGGRLAPTLFVFAGASAIMLLNGYRTVIGVTIWEHRVRVVTPLSEREFHWDQVRVRYYVFRIDMHVSGSLWPYMYAPIADEGRSAMHIIRRHATGR